VLLTFFDFPAENWCHIGTTNPIESTFATIRLRHQHLLDLIQGVRFIDGVNEHHLKEEDLNASQTSTVHTEIVT